MVIYFSGTGNSEYVAKRVAAKTNDDFIDLFSKIRGNEFTKLDSSAPFVLVCPTYAWRIPKILEQWLERAEFSGNRSLYFVMTCGGNIGNAAAYCEELCRKKGMNFMGCSPVIMPENYIALFKTPTPSEAREIIKKAESQIDAAAALISAGKPFSRPKITLIDKLSSGIVNVAFYRLFVHAKKFYATDSCTSCGNCVRVCPLGNIELKSGKPVWENRCTHCMACGCPAEAIEYKKKSKGKERYLFEKTIR